MPVQTPDTARGICVFNETEAGKHFDQWLATLEQFTTKLRTTTEDGIRFVHIPIYGHKKVCRWFFATLNLKGLRK